MKFHDLKKYCWRLVLAVNSAFRDWSFMIGEPVALGNGSEQMAHILGVGNEKKKSVCG